MPARWGSLELENTFSEQLEAAAYIAGLLSLPQVGRIPEAESERR